MRGNSILQNLRYYVNKEITMQYSIHILSHQSIRKTRVPQNFHIVNIEA